MLVLCIWLSQSEVKRSDDNENYKSDRYDCSPCANNRNKVGKSVGKERRSTTSLDLARNPVAAKDERQQCGERNVSSLLHASLVFHGERAMTTDIYISQSQCGLIPIGANRSHMRPAKSFVAKWHLLPVVALDMIESSQSRSPAQGQNLQPHRFGTSNGRQGKICLIFGTTGLV